MRAIPALVLLALAASAVPVDALPTPGLHCAPAEAATGRVFPEAMQTNDFVSYSEARCGLEVLDGLAPDLLEIVTVTESVGWPDLAGGHRRYEVFVVEVTDETSAVPRDEKAKIVFQLSIHGNEKGGREGGLRVIEDFARGLGLAADRPDLADMLDRVMLVFVFPNPDGWVHEELEHRHGCARYFGNAPVGPDGCLDSQNFVRGNGNGVDLNRETPTRGWHAERHTALSEPESVGLVNFLLNYTNVKLASDIHGMLQPANANLPVDPFDPTAVDAAHLAPPDRGNFVLTMLPAGRQSPDEMAWTTTLAERVKERLNGDPYFAEWRATPRPLGAWGGEFNDWGTVWDTLSYTDSGFTSDWYAQDPGLDAPGIDFEYSYNHITFDNYYPGLAQRINDYHVRITRDIVEAFMDHLAEGVSLRVDAGGRDTAALLNPFVATNRDNAGPTRGLEGWAAENAADDAWDLAHADYEARPHDYWDDLAPFVEGGALDTLRVEELPARLATYENLVVAGSAWDALAASADAQAAVRAWTEAGGTLVLTDDALQYVPILGLADEAGVDLQYAGFTDFLDRDHPLAADVRGLARELVEPVPLGYELGRGLQGNLPSWWVKGGAVEPVGTALTDDHVNVGLAPLGAGRVVFFGAFLPDPTEAFDHPYGLDSYATTYSANQMMLNALGWTRVLGEQPLGEAAVAAPAAQPPEAGVPAAGLLAALGAVAVVAALRRR